MLRAASLAALSLLAALVIACGGGAASGDADPATAVPADALLYAEATVRPDGDVRDDAEAAAGKVLRTDDPAAKIRELLDRAFAESGDREITYERDIEPWLGDRLGVWFSGRSDDGVVLLAAVTDTDAALDAVHKDKSERVTQRSYRDVNYEVDEDGMAVGIVGDFLAGGAEPEFKRTVDAFEGDSLAESDRYRSGVDDLEDQRLAHFYVDLKRVMPLAMASERGGEEQLRQLQALLPFDKLPPIFGAFLADGDRLALDVSVRGEGARGLGALGNFGAGGSTPLMQELPGDSWAAFAAADYGRQLRTMFQQYAGVFGAEALRQQLGVDIERDVLSWIGDVAVFVRGETVDQLDGGLVIQVTDAGRAETGFGKLVGLLQATGGMSAKPVTIEGAETAFAARNASLPRPLILARCAERVVVAYGAEAAEAALSPSSTLGDSDVYGRAKDVLEDLDPSLLLSMPAVISLVDSAGEADAEFEQARPYLEAYDVIALGSEGGDNGGRIRFAAGMR
jgi:hypothetical protein